MCVCVCVCVCVCMCVCVCVCVCVSINSVNQKVFKEANIHPFFIRGSQHNI